ncbi:hypothetical protein Lal_00032382 [Lupinus albus]|nr:hypothetical protein Lal_00032382 [Lupinus albus]
MYQLSQTVRHPRSRRAVPRLRQLRSEMMRYAKPSSTYHPSISSDLYIPFGHSFLDTEAPPARVCDMSKLAYLHEPGVLYNLACRFSLNEIYTYTWNILIAVNSFQRLPNLYDIHTMEQYKGAEFGELSPHLFAVADTCYRAMINENGGQSILVSGESGACKT